MIFFKLTQEMGKLLRTHLTCSEWKLWSYLVTLDPFGDKYIELPPTLTILSEVDISKRSFWRAISKFQELELFDFQDKGFQFRNTSVPNEVKIHGTEWHRCAKNGTVSDTNGTVSDTNGTQTIYTELQTLSDSNAHEEKKAIATIETAIATKSATTKPTLSEIPEAEIQSLVKTEFSQGEEFSAIVSAPEKPKPKPKPRIEASESWPPAGPWNINGQLDMNFRDAIAQSWVTAYGGDVHKKKADVLRHFKKDPDNLAIAWEQYQSEYLNRYETTQILMTNGVEIPQEYQRRLIDNQRAITQSLPPEINLITTPVISNFIGPMSSLGGIVKPLALKEAVEPTTITTEDGRAYQTYQKPVIENPATPEQMTEMRERIKAFAQGRGMSPQRPVVELTEEAIALEKKAKKANYLAMLNEMLKDPILRKEAMKEAFNRDDLEFLCDEEGTPYQVIYAES